MTMILLSSGMMKHRANNKKRQTRRERRGKTTGEIRTESREKQEDHRVMRTKAEPQEQKERRVVRKMRSVSPTTLDSKTVSLLCRDGDWVEQSRAEQRFPILNTSFILLRGEEETQHPVQVSIWSPGAPRPRGTRRGFGGQRPAEASSSSKEHSSKFRPSQIRPSQQLAEEAAGKPSSLASSLASPPPPSSSSTPGSTLQHPWTASRE